MKRLLLILKTVLVLAIVLGGYFGLREYAIPEVSVTPVRRGTATLAATGNVTVLSAFEASVKSPAQGILTKFGIKDGDEYRNFREGDVVKKGDIIGQVDSGALPFQLQQAKSDLERLKKRKTVHSPSLYELERRKKDLAAARVLLDEKSISANSVRDLEVAVNALTNSLYLEQVEQDYAIQRAEILVAQLQDQLDRFTLRAPIRGILMAPGFSEGDLVFSGNTITKVTSPNKLIKAEINQDDLPAVRNSKRVIVNFFSFPEKNYEGSLMTLVEIGNSNTQRFTAFIKMKEIPAQLLVGQTGEASFIADERHGALLIPASALVGDSVFVFDPATSRITKRRVRVGYTAITTVEVLEGLKEGDRVVSRDVDRQRDNDRVRLRD
jgi:RND family efflux transporter MFP subunit